MISSIKICFMMMCSSQIKMDRFSKKNTYLKFIQSKTIFNLSKSLNMAEVTFGSFHSKTCERPYNEYTFINTCQNSIYFVIFDVL